MQPGDREKPKQYRRRKKHQGADWTPPSASALKEDGVWCKHHQQRHGYKSSKLGFTPERHNGKSYIHWYCKDTGEVLDTIELGRAGADTGVRLDDEHTPVRDDDTQDRPRQDEADPPDEIPSA